MSELKPVRCGCGGEATLVHYWSADYAQTVWYVRCKECDIASGDYFSEAEAVAGWNRAMGERTAKAKVNFKDENFFFGWCECGQYQSSQHPYCPACGCRLIWGEDDE